MLSLLSLALGTLKPEESEGMVVAALQDARRPVTWSHEGAPVLALSGPGLRAAF